MAIRAFHVQEAQGPLAVMTMCFHRVAINLARVGSVSCGRNEKQHCRQNQKHNEEENVRPLIERLVFGNCFGVEGSRLERFAAMRTGCRVGKAKTTTADTSCKTHSAYLFLVFVRGFMLIALHQCLQDWRAVKGWTTVHFQH